MRRHSAWLLFLLVISFVALHAADLVADPPASYPSGRPSRELLWEGPAKAHEARRFGLSGSFATNPADSYHIWSVQSPAYVWPLSGFFKVFGAGYLQLRIFAALIGAVGLAAVYAIARRHALRGVAVAASLLYIASFYNFHLSRGGLLEPYLNTLLALALLAGVLALERLPWLLACQFGFVAALLTKQTAVFALPVVAALCIGAFIAARRRRAPRWQYALTVAVGVVLAAGLAWYVSRPTYWRTLEWNFGHAVLAVEEHRSPSLALLDLPGLLRRFVDPDRWAQVYLYVVPVGALAVVQIVRIGVLAVRRMRIDLVDLVACAWLACALLTLQATRMVAPRFSIIALPPAALLAASLLAACWRPTLRLGIRVAPVVALLLLVLATDIRWHLDWWRARTYVLHSTGASLVAELGESSVVVGAKAPALVFDTQAETFYVKRGFNNTQAVLARLGITHLIRADGDPPSRFDSFFEEEYAAVSPRLSITLDGRSYTVYRLYRGHIGGRDTEPLLVEATSRSG